MELRITEIFLSIQGESSHAGRPCSFVRLTGCPMRCVWCDSEYTFYGGEKIGFNDVFAKLDEFGCNLVEVTGGEPLAQKTVFPFITELCDRGYEVLIETGGYVSTESVDPRASVILDVKCPGSGEAERNHWPNLERLRKEKDEVKFVVADMRDWEFSRDVITKYDLPARAKEVLISPVHGTLNLAELALAVSRSGSNVRLNLQLHKYIWGADAKRLKRARLLPVPSESKGTSRKDAKSQRGVLLKFRVKPAYGFLCDFASLREVYLSVIDNAVPTFKNN